MSSGRQPSASSCLCSTCIQKHVSVICKAAHPMKPSQLLEMWNKSAGLLHCWDHWLQEVLSRLCSLFLELEPKLSVLAHFMKGSQDFLPSPQAPAQQLTRRDKRCEVGLGSRARAHESVSWCQAIHDTGVPGILAAIEEGLASSIWAL